jgi:hypothetical protein
MKKSVPVLIAAGLVLACLVLAGNRVVGQDAEQGDDQDTAKAAEKDTTRSFEQKFWKWLQKVEYREHFAPWPGMEKGFYPGQSPHGAKLKLFVNRPVVTNPDKPGYNAVIVKENFTEDEKLAAVTIMYRMKKGYDPDHGDWYWAKYLPDGKVAEADGMKIAGRVKSCIECHASAKGDDYIFTNDPE